MTWFRIRNAKGLECGKMRGDSRKQSIQAGAPNCQDPRAVETVSDFVWGGGSKITADGDCSHEIKRHLLHGRKVMTNLDSIFKSRDITFAD